MLRSNTFGVPRFWALLAVLAVVALAVTVFAMAQSPSPAIAGHALVGPITVNDDAGGSASESAPCNIAPDYVLIQDAIDHAAVGATINVCPGIYTEALTIGTDGLTLTGDVGDSSAGPGGGAPILYGGGVVDAAITLANTVSGVTIEGFEIRDYANAAYDPGNGAGSSCSLGSGGVGSGILSWNTGATDITI